MEVVEADYQNQPTYLIKHKNGYLWRVVDGVPVWSSRHEVAWHTLSKVEVHKALSEVKILSCKEHRKNGEFGYANEPCSICGEVGGFSEKEEKLIEARSKNGSH